MIKVTTLLLNDIYDGNKSVLIENTDYELINTSRYSDLIRLYNEHHAVYFLLGPKCLRRKVYVGQTTNIYKRFKLHDKNKEFWEEIVIIIKKSRPFTKTELEWLESQCILQIISSNYYDVIQNYLIPTGIIIDEKDRPGLCECFETIKLLLEIINCPIIKQEIIQDDMKRQSLSIIDRIVRSYKTSPDINNYNEYEEDETIHYKEASYLINSDGSIMILEGSILYGDIDKYKEKMNGNKLLTYIFVENEEQAKIIIG